jgi:hypothetical protein
LNENPKNKGEKHAQGQFMNLFQQSRHQQKKKVRVITTVRMGYLPGLKYVYDQATSVRECRGGSQAMLQDRVQREDEWMQCVTFVEDGQAGEVVRGRNFE